MGYYTGQLITDYIVATEGQLFPPAGGTNASITPAGALFVPTIAIVTGSDTYRVTFTPTTSGTWLFDVTDSLGTQWIGTYPVDVATGAVEAASSIVRQAFTDTAGQTFATLASFNPLGASWTPTITEMTPGVYLAAATLPIVGTWTWVGQGSVSGRVFTLTWDAPTNDFWPSGMSWRAGSRARGVVAVGTQGW